VLQPGERPALPVVRTADPDALEIGRGGADGFLATGPAGSIHVIVGGKYRTGAAPASLSPAEAIPGAAVMNGVRIAIDTRDQPHVVFTTGMTSAAKQSFYTARLGGRWLPPEKFADAADFPERNRAYVADVAVDEGGHVLACFWVSRPEAKRRAYDEPSFYYRWRSPQGAWGAPQSLPAHWSSAPKVEYAAGRGFHLLWQHRGTDWRIAGPTRAGGTFRFEESFSSGNGALTPALSTVQNEGADFSLTRDGVFIVAGNVRERFDGPVGAWATVGRAGALETPVFLGGLPGTVRGSESGVHPVTAFDVETGVAFVALMDPSSKTARFAVHRPGQGWERVYHRILAGGPTPQGTLRQGPSLADVPGPGVLALVRDGEERWFLKRLVAR
jgi:hypothetical protein